jgi:isopentenyl diphosphate isomerase/L-lactate dehydrogenase-like FMN-dependent dehydrogenase
VAGQAEVLLDGGVRTGMDVAKALALGARAVLVGRAYVMGLAVGGAAGVHRILEVLDADLNRTLGFLGCAGVGDLGPGHVTAPAAWCARNVVSYSLVLGLRTRYLRDTVAHLPRERRAPR